MDKYGMHTGYTMYKLTRWSSPQPVSMQMLFPHQDQYQLQGTPLPKTPQSISATGEHMYTLTITRNNTLPCLVWIGSNTS